MRNTILMRRARLAAFAPQAVMPARPNPQLEISALQHHRLREPVSGRSYTVIKLQTRGGLDGYGECRDATSADVAQVLPAVRGKDATQFETVRYRLTAAPAGLAAALNMAMLDVVGRFVKAPVYQVLGGPTRNKCRALAPLD